MNDSIAAVESQPSSTVATAAFPEEIARPLRVLVLSGVFPSCSAPSHGVFVKDRVKAIADLPGYEVRVIAPIPYFPPLRGFERWYKWSQYPRAETVDGLPVLRPRYLMLPKVGGYLESGLMLPAARRGLREVRKHFNFDLIDAHWVYPGGVVATHLGRLFNRPVVITGRGEDMMCFPNYPLIGKKIRRALRNGGHFVAVSREIKTAMQAEGAEPEKITVIPNGVDSKRFRPRPRQEARWRLGLPPHGRLILAVGDRLELKGFHLLVDALPAVRRRFPDASVVIVGGPGRHGRDYTPEIQKRMTRNGLQDYITMAGARPHEELAWWYSAADVFALLSSREGSPNVLMEALACGTPAVATSVGGIPDILTDPRLGVLLTQRTADAAAHGILKVFDKSWDRTAIHRAMQTKTWRHTARAVAAVFERAVTEHATRSAQ